MKKIILSLIALALSPEIFAVDMAYYVPNGLPAVGDAFTRLALTFSDTSYKAIFASVAVLGMGIAFTKGYIVKPLSNNLGSVEGLGYLFSFLMGSAIYFGGFYATANIHIYDSVKNETQTVPQVPQLIVLIAGLSNLIERNFTDIVNTGSAHPYHQTAGAMNIQLLLNANKAAITNNRIYLSKDIQALKTNCGNLTMSLAGTQITEETMFSGAISQYANVTSWTHPTVSVGIYNGTPGLEYVSCTEALKRLTPSLNEISFSAMVQDICRSSGFDVTKIAQLQTCKNLLSEASKIHGTTVGITAEAYVREAFIAKNILKAINSEDKEEGMILLMQRQLALEGLGSITAAQETQPQLRAAMTSVILGAMPFLMLLLVTPLWSAALKFMSGAIIWLALWGVMMAVSHVSTMDAAAHVLNNLGQSKMGLNAFLSVESDAVKALLIYGKMQTKALMVATVIMMALGFGSYALASMAQGLSSNMASMGEGAAQRALTPEGRQDTREGLTRGIAGDSIHAGQDLTHAMTNAAILNQQGVMGSGQAVSNIAADDNNSIMNTAREIATTQALENQANAVHKGELQEKTGNGDPTLGALGLAALNTASTEGAMTKVGNIAQQSGYDQPLNEKDIKEIQSNLAQNNGSYVMPMEEFKDSGFYDHMSGQQQSYMQDYFAENENIAISGLTFDNDGGIVTQTLTGEGSAARIDNSSSINESFNSDDSTTITSNARWDQNAVLDLAENGINSEHYSTFKENYNKSKEENGAGARDNIISSSVYPLHQIASKSSEEVDQNTDSTSLSGNANIGVNSPFGGVGGSVNTTNTDQKTSIESERFDNINREVRDMWNNSDNAKTFLNNYNEYYNNLVADSENSRGSEDSEVRLAQEKKEINGKDHNDEPTPGA